MRGKKKSFDSSKKTCNKKQTLDSQVLYLEKERNQELIYHSNWIERF